MKTKLKNPSCRNWQQTVEYLEAFVAESPRRVQRWFDDVVLTELSTGSPNGILGAFNIQPAMCVHEEETYTVTFRLLKDVCRQVGVRSMPLHVVRNEEVAAMTERERDWLRTGNLYTYEYGISGVARVTLTADLRFAERLSTRALNEMLPEDLREARLDHEHKVAARQLAEAERAEARSKQIEARERLHENHALVDKAAGSLRDGMTYAKCAKLRDAGYMLVSVNTRALYDLLQIPSNSKLRYLNGRGHKTYALYAPNKKGSMYVMAVLNVAGHSVQAVHTEELDTVVRPIIALKGWTSHFARWPVVSQLDEDECEDKPRKKCLNENNDFDEAPAKKSRPARCRVRDDD